MSNILDKIFSARKEDVESDQRKTPLTDLKGKAGDAPPALDAPGALNQKGKTRIISEIKLRTPFKGTLREGIEPQDIAGIYENGGAASISVLTENRHFGGSVEIFSQVREAVNIPLLRKDFIFSEYQVYEARAMGADWFLLIATWLDKSQMSDLAELGRELGMNALIETHNEADLEKAFHTGARILGINNRDLGSGKTDLDISRRLIPMALQEEGKILVCESGIHGRKEIEEFEAMGAHAFLIGESLMTAPDISSKLQELLNDDWTLR